MEYTFIKSKRKTIGITIKQDGTIILRAPLTCSKKRAEAFLIENQDWIERTQKRILERKQEITGNSFTLEEMNRFKKKATQILVPMTQALAKEVGVDYGRITIRAQKSRWGSCSSKGNLNFNCLLILLPENVQRYVIVHELCHRKEMNHSKNFWAEVAKYQPTYRTDRKQLKEMGSPLIERLP